MNKSSEIIFLSTVADTIAAVGQLADTFTVTDENVARLYPDLIKGRHIVLPAGEDSKSLVGLTEICREMIQTNCDRHTTVVAVGGGVVGDLAGFAAAVFMRGVNWVNVPTTLLAQVDSGIGGKTAVDLDDYKNIVGAFWLPRQILICPQLLKTLNAREWLCGMGEVVKTAFLDESVFKTVANGFEGLKARNAEEVAKTVKACAAFKQSVVTEDFTEQGRRKILNLGHTVGHALEKCDRHSRSHGEYVLWGLLAEFFLFKNSIHSQFYEKSVALITELLKDCAPVAFNPSEVANAAKSDKKNSGGKISVIAAENVGEQREMFTDCATLAKGLANWQNLTVVQEKQA